MPTLKPRISITLDHQEIAILDRYAAASGCPRASILADLIRVTLPQLKEAAELIEMANAAPRHIKQGLVDNLSNATADAMGLLKPFSADYGKIMHRLQQELNLPEPGQRVPLPSFHTGPLPPAKVQAYADTNGLPPKDTGTRAKRGPDGEAAGLETPTY